MMGPAHNRHIRYVGAVCAGLFVSCGADDSGIAYVASGASDRVFALQLRTGAVVDSVALDPRPFETDEPHAVAVTPDGRHLFVTLAHGEPTLWKLELPDLRVIGQVPLGIPGAGRIGITPDGRTAFIPDYYRDDPSHAGLVARVRLDDLTVTGRLALCGAPHDAAPDPSGALVAVTCSGSDEIVVLDGRTFTELHRFSVTLAGHSTTRPLNLVWTPRSDTVYVTLQAADRIAAFTPEGRLVGSFPTGRAPAQLARAANGTLVVANRGDGTISVGRPGAGPLRRIAIGAEHPHGVAVTADGSTAVVTFEGPASGIGGAVGIDLEHSVVLWSTNVGVFNLGVTVITPNRSEPG